MLLVSQGGDILTSSGIAVFFRMWVGFATLVYLLMAGYCMYLAAFDKSAWGNLDNLGKLKKAFGYFNWGVALLTVAVIVMYVIGTFIFFWLPELLAPAAG